MKKHLQTTKRLAMLMIVLLLGRGAAWAFDFSSVCPTGQTLYYTITDSNNHYVSVVAPGGYNSWVDYYTQTGAIEIPATVVSDGVSYTVTSIGDNAFDGCDLTSIEIPNSLTSIGNQAFFGCYEMTSVTFGNSVTTIGSNAFSGCNGLTSIVFPNSITSIEDYAFWECSSLTSIEFSDSLTSIGDYAFYYCSSLISIELPNSLTSIEAEVFAWCSGLTSVTIGNSVTTIGAGAFSECTGLTSITIPNSVTTIGGGAFSNCSSLTSITIPNSVTTIGAGAFSECTGLTSITIPNSVTFIDDDAFNSCSGLTSLIIGNSVTSIGDYAFLGCSSLTSVEIPNSVTSIGSSAFSNCRGLTSIEIPESVISIGSYAFSRCYDLTSVTIPNSVTSLGEGVFNNCSGLTSVEIPGSIISVGDYAFEGCNGLTRLVVLAETPPSFGSNSFDGVADTIPIYVPTGSLEAYATANWGGFSNFLPFSSGDITVSAHPVEGGMVTGAGYYEALQTCIVTATANEGYAFAYWTVNGAMVSTDTSYSFTVCGDRALEAHFVMPGDAIVFADSLVKAICVAHWDYNGDGELGEGEAAAVTNLRMYFQNDQITSFDELQYFTGLTSMESTFWACSGLTSVVIPSTVTSMYSAFGYCSSLTSVVIPNSVVSIGEWTFYNCSNLTSIEMSNSVTSIGERTFYNCSSLTSIEIPNSVTSIGNSAFSNCCSLTSIEIPNSVTDIGNYAFSGCSGLTSVYYSGDVGQWCGIVFLDSYSNPLYYAHNLYINNTLVTNLVVPNSVTSIGNYAFCGCNGLTSVEIPSSVTSIGSTAFSDCSGLTSVYYSGDVGQWCGIAFLDFYSNPLLYAHNLYINNTLVTNLVIPNSVTSIGNYAFIGCSGLTSVKIPNSVTSIGGCAFSSCGLTSLEIPESVVSLGNYAFSGCRGLTSIEIPNSVTSIEDHTFYNCSGLTSIEIPSSVTSIGNYAFYGCSGLSYIMVMANTPPMLGNYAFPGNKSIPVYVPCGREEAYSSVSWGGFRKIYGLCAGEITVTAHPAEGGTVTGAGYYDGGAICTLTATANEGYTFVDWRENGQVVSTEAEYTFIVCQDRNLTARFYLPFTITAIANPTEGGTVSGSGEYNYGSTCTLIATANEGFVFNGWWKDGVAVSSYDSFSFMVTASGDYVAVFESIPNGVYIGDGGTATNEYLPSYSYYNYSLSQQIYTAEEIGRGGTIKSVAFFNGGATRTRNFDVYMVSTEKTAFENTNDWIPVTGSDLVFSGQVTINANEWTTLQFDTPFQYDGMSNIVLIVDDNTGGWACCAQVACRVFETQGNQAIRVYEDSPNYNPYNPSGYTGTLHSVKNQIILGMETEVQQTIVLSAGWNWVSLYIDAEDPVELLQMLEAALGENAEQIQSSETYTEYFAGGWWGELDEEGITSDQTYWIYATTDCTVELEGTPVNTEGVEITINPGWNWIGFPSAVELQVNEALAGFEAENGDQLQGEDIYTEYYGGWWGELETLIPGEGYWYYSSSNVTKTLVFSTAAKGKRGVHHGKRKE